jgi:galactokinase
MIENHRPEFGGKIYERCIYVVQENQRVLAAAEDLKNGDLKAFGEKMHTLTTGFHACMK